MCAVRNVKLPEDTVSSRRERTMETRGSHRRVTLFGFEQIFQAFQLELSGYTASVKHIGGRYFNLPVNWQCLLTYTLHACLLISPSFQHMRLLLFCAFPSKLATRNAPAAAATLRSIFPSAKI